MDVQLILLISAGFWAFILVVLLFVWAFTFPTSKTRKKDKHSDKQVKDDLENIKDQING